MIIKNNIFNKDNENNSKKINIAIDDEGNYYVSDKDFKKWIKLITGFNPKNISLYQQAFFHSSVSVKRSGTIISNERLEFLGDAILGAIIADYLFKMFPFKDEG